MPTAGITHHLVLNGIGYMVRQGKDGLAYRRSEIPYFVPRRADAVGRDALTRPGADNAGFTAGVQSDYGQAGYARAQGIDARAGDGLRIAAKLDTTTGLAVRVLAWADFNGTVYAGTATGAALKVYKYTIATNTFAELGGLATDAVRLVPLANHLWFAQSTGFIVEISLADVATLASGSNSAGIIDLGRGGTRLFGVTAPAGSRAVRWTPLTADVPATAPFNSFNEPGDPREPLNNLVGLGDHAYIGKADGLYRVSFDDTNLSITMTRVADHTARRDTNNFKAMTIFNNDVYYAVRDRLYRYTGATETDVSPPVSVCGPSGEGVVRYVVKALAAGSGWLWALTESDEATKSLHLWAYHGERWEQLVQIVQHASAQVGTMHYSPNAGRLFINYNDGAGWKTDKIEIRPTSDLPAASFSTSNNYCYLPPIDGGLPEVTKRFHSVALRGSGFSVSAAVHVWYWNGASWISLGSLTTPSGGELAFPGAVTGKNVLLRLDLRSDGSLTPIVREIGVTYDVLPGPARTVEFEAVLAPNLRLLDGTVESNSPTTLLANLDTARAAGMVVTLTDPVTSATGSAALTVRVTDVTVKALLATPNASGQYGWLVGVTCEVVG